MTELVYRATLIDSVTNSVDLYKLTDTGRIIGLDSVWLETETPDYFTFEGKRYKLIDGPWDE